MPNGKNRPDDQLRFRPFDKAAFRWKGIDVDEYKRHKGEQPGEGWQNITRQVLAGRFGEPCSFRLRYFEVGSGGHSSLEKHQHVHIVLVLRGKGKVIVGDDVYDTEPFDVVYVPPMVPHQFVNEGQEPYGFLCIVDGDRDKPLPLSPDELQRMRSSPETAAAVRIMEP